MGEKTAGDTRTLATLSLSESLLTSRQPIGTATNPLAAIDSHGRLALIQRVLVVVWGYTIAVWLYVVAMQLRYPSSVYWSLALWLPIRLDYLGEAAFILSFLLAIMTTSVSVARRRLRYS